MTDYGSWNLTALRSELKKRNARVSGRKRELIERLDAYDRNYNFGGGERVEREYCMEVPSYKKYKDINKDTVITRIKEEAVCAYLGKMNREIDANVRYLYESKFLKYARLACEDGLFFVKAECKAQMKKTMSYAVDASFDVDGCVVECQCECAVGMGPVAACKHVCLILYALQKFCENGDLTTEETCTQNLQHFTKQNPTRGVRLKLKTSLLQIMLMSFMTHVHFNLGTCLDITTPLGTFG